MSGGGRRVVVHEALPHREPLAWDALLAYLETRAVPGTEEVVGATYRRTLRLGGGAAVMAVSREGGELRATWTLADPADLDDARTAARRALDLDADPQTVDAALGDDPALGPLVAATPGRRVPGHVDPFELTVRTILGQQVSVAGARTHAARLVAAHGEPLAAADGGLTHLFPSSRAVAAIDPATLAMPRSRGRALTGLGQAVVDGLDLGDRAALLALPGIGPWTVAYVHMRGFADRDAWLPTDLGVVKGLARLGLPADAAARWRPWRAYALQHVWSVL